MRTIISLLITSLLIIGCKQSTDSGTDDGTTKSSEISLIEQTDLPQTGGSVNSFAVAPNGTIVAVVDGRLFRVEATTQAMTQIGNDTDLLSVTFAANNQLYALANGTVRTYDLSTQSSSAIALSFGQPNWSSMQIICPSDGSILVSNPDGFGRTSLYRSTNGGSSWTKVTVPDVSFKCYFLAETNGNLLAASAKGVWRSNDNAATWTQLTSVGLNFVDVRVFETSAGDIFYWAPRINQMYVSRSGGAFLSMTRQGTMPPPLEMAEGAAGVLYMTGTDVQSGQAIVPSGIMRSNDAGQTWAFIEHGIVRPIITNGSLVLVGTTDDGGILHSNDGTTWHTMGRMTIANVDDFGFDKDGQLLLSGGGALYRQSATRWQTLGQFGTTTKFAANATGGIVVAGVSTGVWRTSDNGASWSAAKLPALTTSQWATQVIEITALKDNKFLLGLDQYSSTVYTWVNGALFKSADDGATFGSLAFGNFTSVVQDPTTGTLYGHTENFADNLKSTDGGATWDTTGWNISPFAITNTGKAISTTSLGFKISPLMSQSWHDVTVKNATSGFFPKRIIFTADDKMHLLAITQLDGVRRLYVSDDEIR